MPGAASTKKLLGVFAHPDDEVFCAGGTFARYTAEGAEAMIVCATRGEAGQIRDARRATRKNLAEVREAELRESCSRLGVTRVVCLDHTDGHLASMDREALRDEVAGFIADFRPDAVVTFGPDGAYGHPDHIVIGEVTTEAVRATALPETRLFCSHFPRSRLLLAEHLSQWLVQLKERFRGHADFARAFSLFATETGTMGFASDYMDIEWFPPGLFIVEQGEPADSLYLVLSGEADVVKEQDGTSATVEHLAAGDFFGELGVIGGQRQASVVARDSVTCLVFSPGEPTAFAGRGGVSPLATHTEAGAEVSARQEASTVIDVSAHIDSKIAAIAAHRTQYPIEPGAFPHSLLVEMMGREHFQRVHPPRQPETDFFKES